MAMDPPSGTLEWDRDVPKGSVAWNQGDNDIRRAMEILEEGIDHEHEHMSDMNQRGNHLEGSARAWIIGARPDYTDDPYGTGRLYFNASHMLQICTDGASNTWAEIDEFWTEVAFNAGLRIPSGDYIRGTAGQNWLSNVTYQMDPFVHAARHLTGGGDPIAALGAPIQAVQSAPKTDVGDLPGVTMTLNYGSRSGTSHGVALGVGTVYAAASGNRHVYIQLGGASQGTHGYGWGPSSGYASNMVELAYITGIPKADGQILKLRCTSASGTGSIDHHRLFWFDLGEE